MMFPILDSRSDLHVHSTFSDGASTVEENVASAAGHGMHTLGLVDHVRRSTDWLPSFVSAVRTLNGTGGLRILCGVEAKIPDVDGTIDMPGNMPSLDYVLVADHQLPRPDGPMHPRDAAELLQHNELSADVVVGDLVEATMNSLDCYDRVILAHLFSILPKCGLSEDDVPDALVRRLGQAAKHRDVIIEVNEKWACPSKRVVDLLADAGVDLTMSTDAHHEARVGRYDYVSSTLADLATGETAMST